MNNFCSSGCIELMRFTMNECQIFILLHVAGALFTLIISEHCIHNLMFSISSSLTPLSFLLHVVFKQHRVYFIRLIIDLKSMMMDNSDE